MNTLMNSKRIILGMMIAILLMAIIFPVSFIASHHNHEHHHHDHYGCMVCSVLAQCEKLLYELSTGVSLKTAGNSIVFLCVTFLYCHINSVVLNTPVSRKVRLNN